MLKNQKHLFYLDDESHYLNNAYMSPNMKAVEIAGIVAIRSKNKPYNITTRHFFEPMEKVKQEFAKLINCPSKDRIAIVPSVSYGIANAAANIDCKGKSKIIIPGEQFPSNYYSWEELAKAKDLTIEIIDAPKTRIGRAQLWNEKIIDAIDDSVAIVACAHVHWTDGSLFKLKEIKEACNKVNAYLVIDASQSLGALPLDIQEVKPDVLVCAGYKWLFGPYNIGLAYYNEKFDHGRPIEESWLNRKDSDNFQSLVNYQPVYRPEANRYSMGEGSSFINIPMLLTALQQLNGWGVQNIQDYSRGLIKDYLQFLQDLGCTIEKENYRCNHLLGLSLPPDMQISRLKERLKEHKVFVSMRGESIRVSTSVYNTRSDLDQLISVLHEERLA